MFVSKRFASSVALQPHAPMPDVVQHSFLATRGVNLTTISQDTYLPASDLPQQAPLALQCFTPKDQLMVFLLHKVLTFPHQVPAPPIDPTAQKEFVALPRSLSDQPTIQKIDIPILQVSPEVNSNSQYAVLLSVLTSCIDLYCNTFRVNPPPADNQIYDAMMRVIMEKHILIDIDINSQFIPQQQQYSVHPLGTILAGLSHNPLTYTYLPLLTTAYNSQTQAQMNPDNTELFPSIITQIHQADADTTVVVFNPPQFILPIHIPLMILLSRVIMPGLGNVISQMMPQNFQTEQARAYRFHTAMCCVYNQLVAITTMLLSSSISSQITHKLSIDAQKIFLKNPIPFIWVFGEHQIPPQLAEQTQTPNPAFTPQQQPPMLQQQPPMLQQQVVVQQTHIQQQQPPDQKPAYVPVCAPVDQQQEATQKYEISDKGIGCCGWCGFWCDCGDIC